MTITENENDIHNTHTSGVSNYPSLLSTRTSPLSKPYACTSLTCAAFSANRRRSSRQPPLPLYPFKESYDMTTNNIYLSCSYCNHLITTCKACHTLVSTPFTLPPQSAQPEYNLVGEFEKNSQRINWMVSVFDRILFNTNDSDCHCTTCGGIIQGGVNLSVDSVSLLSTQLLAFPHLIQKLVENKENLYCTVMKLLEKGGNESKAVKSKSKAKVKTSSTAFVPRSYKLNNTNPRQQQQSSTLTTLSTVQSRAKYNTVSISRNTTSLPQPFIPKHPHKEHLATLPDTILLYIMLRLKQQFELLHQGNSIRERIFEHVDQCMDVSRLESSLETKELVMKGWMLKCCESMNGQTSVDTFLQSRVSRYQSWMDKQYIPKLSGSLQSVVSELREVKQRANQITQTRSDQIHNEHLTSGIAAVASGMVSLAHREMKLKRKHDELAKEVPFLTQT